MRSLFVCVLFRAIRRLVAEQRQIEDTSLRDYYLAGGPDKITSV